MKRILYVRVKSPYKNGGVISQNEMSKYLTECDDDNLYFVTTSAPNFLRKLFNTKPTVRNQFFILSVTNNLTIKNKIKIALNRNIFKKAARYVNRISVSKIVLDCNLPDFVTILKEHTHSKILMSVVRSSPHCFSWTNHPERALGFRKQLNLVDCIICSSTEVADMWQEYLSIEKPLIKLTNPFETITKNANNLDSFLEDDSLNLFVVVGSLGPRKGLNLIIRALEKVNFPLNMSIALHVFGTISDWKPKFESLSNNNQIKVVLHGFKNLNMSVKPLKKCLFLFSSFSEVASRAPKEAIRMQVPLLINRYSMDGDLRYLIKTESIFSNHIELSQKIELLLSDFEGQKSNFVADSKEEDYSEYNLANYVEGINKIKAFVL